MRSPFVFSWSPHRTKTGPAGERNHVVQPLRPAEMQLSETRETEETITKRDARREAGPLLPRCGAGLFKTAALGEPCRGFSAPLTDL